MDLLRRRLGLCRGVSGCESEVKVVVGSGMRGEIDGARLGFTVEEGQRERGAGRGTHTHTHTPTHTHTHTHTYIYTHTHTHTLSQTSDITHHACARPSAPACTTSTHMHACTGNSTPSFKMLINALK